MLVHEGELAMRKAGTFRVWFVAMLLMSAGCFGQSIAAQEKTDANRSAAYRIAAGDVLQIDVWKQPEITRTIPVQSDGTIRLPLVDGMKVSGLTAMQLAGLLRQKLTSFLENPQVTVTVVRIHGTFVPTMPTIQPAMPILPQRAPQMRDMPPAKCCVA
jgi:polysaccharide biosynthesis/export protein